MRRFLIESVCSSLRSVHHSVEELKKSAPAGTPMPNARLFKLFKDNIVEITWPCADEDNLRWDIIKVTIKNEVRAEYLLGIYGSHVENSASTIVEALEFNVRKVEHAVKVMESACMWLKKRSEGRARHYAEIEKQKINSSSRLMAEAVMERLRKNFK